MRGTKWHPPVDDKWSLRWLSTWGRVGAVNTSFATCCLCEANCGIVVEHDGTKLSSVRGDDADPLSRGYICPKAAALADVQSDPDRLRAPVRRNGDQWSPVSYSDALEEVATRIEAIQREHGPDSVALYLGNPVAHSYSAVLSQPLLVGALGSKSFFSANSVDGLPTLLNSFLMFGSQALQPIPDIDRTDFMLILGANPAVSNGSLMTAPDVRNRLKAIRERGGTIVVVDPRRTETAELADRHHFIRPGTDGLLLAALVATVFEENLLRLGRLDDFVDGLEVVRARIAGFTPERVAAATGLKPDVIRALARAFATAPSALCYGRMGTSVQEFGSTSTWLCHVLNTITGNLDRPGGVMFPKAPIDLVSLAGRLGQSGSFGRWRSRVRGMPEVNGEIPTVTLADEMETPGPGQIRALITIAGNPVLSLANGKRLEQLLPKLELMVSVDLYRNETTRHAHFILPTTFGLEHDHFPLLFHALSVRNGAKYTKAVLEKPDGLLHDYEILFALSARLFAKGRWRTRFLAPVVRALQKVGPRRFLAWLMRLGPYGKGVFPWGSGLTLSALEDNPHGVDLGPLEPRLPGVIQHKDKRVHLAPPVVISDLDRLEKRLEEVSNGSLLLIGRRHLRSNNSWMHNSERLVKGRDRCTLMVHPEDAKRLGLTNGTPADIRSRVGTIRAPVEVTDEVMTGVVSLPHGWGHRRQGTALSVAAQHPGVSVNDITDDSVVDAVSGCAVLGGIPVTVEAGRAVTTSHDDRVQS